MVKGDVISNPEDPSATLTLSELGTIDGNVRVGNVMLNGKVVGDVIATNRVELAPKASISGTLTYAMLEMAMGAEVNGKLIHATEQDPPKLEYDGKRRLDKRVISDGEKRRLDKRVVNDVEKRRLDKTVVSDGEKVITPDRT
jgi:cytoskeletal protein CcmA (bactofilin family)